MTLRYATSFDNFQDSDASGVFSGLTVSGPLSTAINFGLSYGRWPTGKGMRFLAQADAFHPSAPTVNALLTFDNQSTWVVGAAFRPISLSATLFGYAVLFAFQSGGTNVIEVRLDGSNILSVTRNGTTIASGASSISSTAHSFVEFKVTIHPTAGSYTLKVNGIPYLSGSGINTSGTGGTTASQFFTGLNGSTGSTGSVQMEWWYDDLYIADGTGSGVNDLQGDCHPIELLPNANGTFSDWAQTGGTAGQPYTAVNETPQNGDTSYLLSSTVGQRTTLRYPSLTSVGNIKAVIVAPWLRKDDANSHTVAARTYESSTEKTSTQTILPNTSYTHQQIVMETDPLDGSAWSVSKINSTEFGLVVAS